MPGGINMDEEKRRMQYMQIRAEQNLGKSQNMDFEGKSRTKRPKDMLITIGVIAGLALLLYLLQGSII